MGPAPLSMDARLGTSRLCRGVVAADKDGAEVPRLGDGAPPLLAATARASFSCRRSLARLEDPDRGMSTKRNGLAVELGMW